MSLASLLRLHRISRRRSDLLAAAVIAVPLFGSLAYRAGHYDQPIVVPLALVALTPIFLRHRQPLLALVLGVALHLTIPDNEALLFPALAVLYTIASEGTWVTPALYGVGVVIASLVAEVLWGSPDRGGVLGAVIVTAASCGAAVALGLYVGARRRVIDGLRERAERLDRERELLADRAVAEERLRIAQELHDAIAHNVSLMVVQAQGLGAAMDDDQVTLSTDAIANLGRQAMAEMHRTLKLLRADQGAAQLAPQPGLANLDRLLDQSRAAGLNIEFVAEGRPRPLPQSIDLSAFRIVQEALTNVIKHAEGSSARVALAYQDHGLKLTITNDGDETDGSAAGPPGQGHGLIGMRERASLFGGTLVAEPRSGRGFQVTATLPYPDAES